MLLALRTFYAKNHLENRLRPVGGLVRIPAAEFRRGHPVWQVRPTWYTDVDQNTGQVTKIRRRQPAGFSYARYAFNDAFPDVSHTLAHEMGAQFSASAKHGIPG